MIAWAFALAYTSSINQAFDDRLDHAGKNPVGSLFDRRRALLLSLIPLTGCLLTLAIFSRDRLFAGLIMTLSATIYSAPPRLKRYPVVGTLWNVVMGIPGFFFAGAPPLFLVALFALLLLVSQLLHEAHDRDDDRAGQVRTVATELGRPATLWLAMIFLLGAPAIAWGHPETILALAAFSVLSGNLVMRHLRVEDSRRLGRLRLYYRWLAIVAGAIAFAATR